MAIQCTNNQVVPPRDDDIKFGQYVVGFLDLVGQAEVLRQMDSIPTNEEESAVFKHKVLTTLGSVLDLRSTFKQYFRGLMSSEESNRLAETLSGKAKETFLGFFEVKYGTQLFFDSVIVYSPLFGDSGSVTTIGVHGIIISGAMSMLLSLAKRKPLRGGMDIGVCTEIGDGDIYGPAVVKAHDLEEKVADYPRIVVGHDLILFLERNICAGAMNLAGHALILKVNAENARIARNIICQDENNVPIIDFLGESIAEMFGADSVVQLAVKEARLYVASEFDRFSREGNEKLARRYARLNRYCESRAKVWK